MEVLASIFSRSKKVINISILRNYDISKKSVINIFFIFCGFIAYGQALEKQTTTETLDFDCTGIKIKFFDSEVEKPDYIIPANWNFLHTTGITPFVQDPAPGEEVDFTLLMPEHFFVEIKSTDEEDDEIFGTLESYDAEGNLIDKITDFRLGQAAGTNFFGSKNIILVSDIDKFDDDFDDEDCPTEIPGNYDYDNVDDIGTDRSIACKIGGKIKAIYQDEFEEINICGGNDGVKTVKLNIYVTNKLINGESVPVIDDNEIANQVEYANKKYAQSCINFTYSSQNLPTPESVNLSDGLYIGTATSNFETPEMINLINPVKADGNTDEIDIIFIEEFANPLQMQRGISIADFSVVDYPDNYTAGHQRTCIISTNMMTPFTFSHEIGHVLSNHGHFGEEYSMEVPLELRGFNLMASNTDVTDNIDRTRRLTPQQIQWMREATDLPE